MYIVIGNAMTIAIGTAMTKSMTISMSCISLTLAKLQLDLFLEEQWALKEIWAELSCFEDFIPSQLNHSVFINDKWFSFIFAWCIYMFIEYNLLSVQRNKNFIL